MAAHRGQGRLRRPRLACQPPLQHAPRDADFYRSAGQILDGITVDDEQGLFTPSSNGGVTSTALPLTTAGWRSQSNRGAFTTDIFTVPHYDAVLRFNGNSAVNHLDEMKVRKDPTMWQLEVAPDHSKIAWNAHFTFCTPHQLIGAFLTAAVNPDPVERDPRLLPEKLLARITTTDRRSAARANGLLAAPAAANASAPNRTPVELHVPQHRGRR